MSKFLDITGLTLYDTKIKQHIASKVTNDLKNYYTKTEVTTMINESSHLKMLVVDSLPTMGGGESNVIYLVPNDGSGSNTYAEYIYIADSDKWEKIGDTAVDLTPYAKTADVEATYQKKADSHTHSNKAVLDATTASYTTNDKTKLSSIASGATADSSITTAEIENLFS